MSTRDILDYKGNVLGQLTLPDKVTEQEWENALSAYKQQPPSPVEIVSRKIADAKDFGDTITTQIAAENILLGITTDQVTQLLSENAVLIAAFQTGSLYTALALLQALKPDNLFITPDRIQKYANMIEDYLGLPLT